MSTRNKSAPRIDSSDASVPKPITFASVHLPSTSPTSLVTPNIVGLKRGRSIETIEWNSRSAQSADGVSADDEFKVPRDELKELLNQLLNARYPGFEISEEAVDAVHMHAQEEKLIPFRNEVEIIRSKVPNGPLTQKHMRLAARIRGDDLNYAPVTIQELRALKDR